MKKIISKINKILIGIGLAIISIPNKIFGYEFLDTPIIPLYGVAEPPRKFYQRPEFWRWIQICIIPVTLLIGLIVYFIKNKKSEEKVSKKPIIISLIIGIILFFVVWALGSYLIN